MGQCQFFFADYCMHHDYDHVLERREASTSMPPVPVVRRDALWVRGGNEMAAEASSLGFRATPRQFAVPARTGELVTFQLHSEVRDERENETLGWLFLDINGAGLAITVLND